MADRYWVGGAGSWNSTTKWSTTSGGASGASVPTSVDNAIFDASSGLVAGTTITVTTGSTCANLSIVGPSAVGLLNFSITAPFTIAGTLSTSATAGNKRIYFASSTYGVMYDVSVASFGTITDMDFRDIRITGAAGTLSGTRIGDRGNNSNITFTAPKTVYWNLTGGGNWSATAWATSSGGTVSTDNFPLPQDTATIVNTGLNTSAIITLDTAIPYIGTIDMSGRTTAMALSINIYTVYGDWKNGSGTTLSSVSTLTFSGGNTQTITSSGKAFSGPVTIDNYGGTVQLADALNIGTNSLTVTNGTFTTNGYAVTAGSLSSSNSNVRTINLGASTVTLAGATSLTLTTSTNLTFNAGTSQINFAGTFAGGTNITYYNITCTSTSGNTNFQGTGVFNNLTFTAPASTGLVQPVIFGNQTINGTLTVAGATAIRRIFLRSDTLGTTRTLTVNSLSANDCDFRDITIAGTAAGTSPTRAGDCGGNTGITFPAPKTVYWNLAGSVNWTDTGWATSSGGTPAVNNFPLAQDTAIFDNTGSAGTVSVSVVNIGTVDASARTSAMTLNYGAAAFFYGNYKLGSGITITGGSTQTFAGRGTQTITSAGKSLTFGITVDCYTGTVQLADALTLGTNNTLTLTSGTFDAVTYNVTTGLFSLNTSVPATFKMGSGTWTISGTGACWNLQSSNVTFFKDTANIVLSDTSATARTFNGGTLSYNKLTIGGATGSSTTTITGNNQFTELASTKTVAHTIALGTTAQTIGKWSVTGSAGNVVTVTGTATLTIAGATTSGIDYLALGTTVLSATSPAEFFAGANSTGGTNFTLTATPAPRTLYWVGGTGNWSSTTKWSTSSGGASGAAIPTSLDAVVFNTLSNATAYTATVDPTQARCASLTIGAPLTGALTFAGTGGLAIAGNTSIAATNVTRTYTGAITLSGVGSYTLTTNGVALASAITVNGVGCTWTLGSALNNGNSNITVTNGSFDTGNYNVTHGGLSANTKHSVSISLGSSTLSSTTGTTIDFQATSTTGVPLNLTFNAGTSTINTTVQGSAFYGGGQTFYNVSYAPLTNGTTSIVGANTFNNLSLATTNTAGISIYQFYANQTINGTLTLSAGTNATMRTMLQSDTLGTTRTLTCNAVAALTDIDFRDITIAGSAAPVSGTRLGDCKGNSGITFDAPKTVYWSTAAGQNWASGTATFGTVLGFPVANEFPLAQDTIVFTATYPTSGQTSTINAAFNIGTINMSARTSNTMTLATGTTTPAIYGNWINGTGTTLSGTGAITFAGRGSQTITSAGKTFTQPFNINSPSGSVTLQDAFVTSAVSTPFTLTAGTFSANNYSVTSASFISSGTLSKVLALGSSTWTLNLTSGTPWTSVASLSVTGTGTLNFTPTGAATFTGAGLNYSGITLNQGGAGTLTITGNNTFGNITNTYGSTGATTIALGTTTQTVANFTAAGTTGKVLTITGTGSNLVYTGGSTISSDYLNVQGRVYGATGQATGVWYAGNNSTNSGTLGWLFTTAPAPIASNSNFFLMFG